MGLHLQERDLLSTSAVNIALPRQIFVHWPPRFVSLFYIITNRGAQSRLFRDSIGAR